MEDAIASTGTDGNRVWFNHENEKRYVRAFYEFPDDLNAKASGEIRWGLPLDIADGIWSWSIAFKFREEDGSVILDPAGIKGPATGQPCSLRELEIVTRDGLFFVIERFVDQRD